MTDEQREAIRARLWAAGMVLTGCEIEVARRLDAAGLAEVYCPTRKRFQCARKKRKAKEKIEALYPGYIFIVEGSIVDIETIQCDTPDFMHFLRWSDDGRLQTIPDEVMDGVRAQERRGRILLPRRIETLFERFKTGQNVRVVSGAFGGYVGTVVSQDRGRVVVAGGDFNIGAELPAELLVVED